MVRAALRARVPWLVGRSVRSRAWLAPFLGPAVDPDAGLAPVPGSAEQVRWVAIAGERTGAGGERATTPSRPTRGSGALRYLAVAVARRPGGGEPLARYPALVGGAGAGPRRARSTARACRPLADPALAAVLDRALRNYLGGSEREPRGRPRPRRTRRRRSRPGFRCAVAAARGRAHGARARDGARRPTPAGDAYTLGYEVSVDELGGRWEITRIEP